MGWFDDNHWAGEAYDFGMGYMARAGFPPGAGLSDLEGTDSDDLGSDSDADLPGADRCQGRTRDGGRCRATAGSPFPAARTIMRLGYCTQHMSQSATGARAAPAPRAPASARHAASYSTDPPLVAAASSGDLQAVMSLLPQGLDNDLSNFSIPAGLDAVGGAGDTALRAAARKGHHEVVIELLCAGADPREPQRATSVGQVVDARLDELALSLRAGLLLPLAARELLQVKSRLLCIKAVVGKACAAWPLPELPAIPPLPACPDVSQLTVEQLKDTLRRHGAKLSGRKAELVERVVAGRLLELDHPQKLKESEAARSEALSRIAAAQQRLEERSGLIRQAGAEHSPRPPTEAEVEAVACRSPGPGSVVAWHPSITWRRGRSRSPRGGGAGGGFGALMGGLRCCYFLQGKCRFGAGCDFEHRRGGGACQFGPSCWFHHHTS